jgi:hypothetical protein
VQKAPCWVQSYIPDIIGMSIKPASVVHVRLSRLVEDLGKFITIKANRKQQQVRKCKFVLLGCTNTFVTQIFNERTNLCYGEFCQPVDDVQCLWSAVNFRQLNGDWACFSGSQLLFAAKDCM